MEYKITKDKRYLDAIYTGIESLTKYHGQVTGIFSGDEHLSGINPTQGSELCSVVEFMFSLQLIYEASKDTRFLDLLEKITYNALPATISEDFKAHQYDQQANQIKVSQEKRNWYNNGNQANLFGFEPNFGCCLANMHQGWPKFVKNAVFTSNNEIYFGAYMPVEVQVNIDNQIVSIKEETNYPFKETIRLIFHCDNKVTMPIHLRIPAWCTSPKMRQDHMEMDVAVEHGYMSYNLQLDHDTELELSLPMEIKLNTNWYHHGLSIERGPIVYALNIEEEWKALSYGHPKFPNYEIYAKSEWNYGIDISKEIAVKEEDKIMEQAFNKKHAPVHLYAHAFKIDDWIMEDNSAGDLPISPIKNTKETVEVELVPYACTKLRISLFPWK